MPILFASPVTAVAQSAFHEIDEIVTGVAFGLHNDFGRYLSESLCQIEFAERLRSRGLEVRQEFQITLTINDFRKDYFADFLINSSVIVETKSPPRPPSPGFPAGTPSSPSI